MPKSALRKRRDGAICAEPVFFVRGVCDNWNFNASNPVVYVGGNYNQNGNHGLFYVNRTSLANTNANHGSRHLCAFANQSSPAKRRPPLCT